MGHPRLYQGCAVPGCARPHAARSYCQSHYVLIVVRGGRVVTCRICGQAWVAPKSSCTDGTHPFCLLAETCPDCRSRASRMRGTSAQRGYGSRWRKVRARQLHRQPWCEGWPAGVVCGKLATEVDHIDGDTANTATSNLRSFCGLCHRRRTAAEQPGGFRLP
jgi:5-methylcytosine-specific restriction protein A